MVLLADFYVIFFIGTSNSYAVDRKNLFERDCLVDFVRAHTE